jgi:hypothetical protein
MIYFIVIQLKLFVAVGVVMFWKMKSLFFETFCSSINSISVILLSYCCVRHMVEFCLCQFVGECRKHYMCNIS